MFDKIKSMALETYLKKHFCAYLEKGDIKVTLNSAAHTCDFSATLAGESEKINLSILKFEILKYQDGSYKSANDCPDEYDAPPSDKFLCVRELDCNRPWLKLLLETHLVGKFIKIPSFIADAI